MATFDNHDAVAIAGKILERLGDKSLELPPESRAKILHDLNDALNVLIEDPSASQSASFAPEKNDEEVSSASSFTTFASHEASSPKPSQVATPDGNNSFSKDLLQHIDDVRFGRIEPRAISDNLRSDVERHEINRCRGDLANEDLWNGSMGWRSAADFYAAISYIWINAREVFTNFDDFREIIENKGKWNQTYFETQRNYLRHNFSLERLCHLVMVYDYLHGRKARIAPTPVISTKITIVPEKKHPFGNDSASANTSSTSLQSRIRWIFAAVVAALQSRIRWIFAAVVAALQSRMRWIFVAVVAVLLLLVAFLYLRDKLPMESGIEDDVQQQPKQTQ